MGFTQQKRHSLKPQKELYLSTLGLGFLVAALFFIPYIIYGHGYFLFYGDFNVQQIPFYKMCHEMIRTGNISWNWETDLGVNFIGSYSFYLLGSPFFLLTLPFPTDFVPHLMGPLLILKFSCAALTSYCYIRRFTRTPAVARLAALLYAFSGFSVYNIFFNHFHEAIIFFPLLLLSVELFITENRRGFFALMIAVCAISNYFFFFGMVVFVIIYWFVRVLSNCYRLSVGRFLWFIFEAVIGVALAAFILYPTYIAVSGMSRVGEFQAGWGAIMYGKEQIYANILQTFFFPPDLPARPVFFPDADVKWSSLGGWLPLFSMVGVFAFMQQKKGNWLRRVIGIMIFMSLVPVLNSAFYMFNSAYYARWFFMPILMMCLATATSIEDTKIEWNSAYKWVLGITIAVTAVIGFFPRAYEDGKVTSFGLYTQDDGNTFMARFFVTCIIAIISLIILKLLLGYLRKNPNGFIKSATVMVCVLSVIYAAFFVGLGKTHSYDDKKIMIDNLIEGKVKLPDNSDNYRIDVYDGVDNTGMYLGLPCINSFHSIVPTSVTKFYEYVGEERGVASRPTPKSYAARALLSVRFLLARTDSDDKFISESGQPKIAGFTYFDTQGGYNIYENQNYIPYGFTYDYYMTKEQCEEQSEADRSNMMVKAILLDKAQIARHQDILKNLNESYALDSEQYGEGLLNVINSESELQNDAALRRSTTATNFKRSNTGFSANITLSKENLVFFSVPYDEGWTATVNGKSARIEEVNVGFMAVRAPVGTNKIVFTYKTPGLNMGILITVSTLALFIVYMLAFTLIKRKKEMVLEYPEGEQLIERWQEEELELSMLELELDPPSVLDVLSENSSNQTEGIPYSGEVGGFDRGFWVNVDEAEQNTNPPQEESPPQIQEENSDNEPDNEPKN